MARQSAKTIRFLRFKQRFLLGRTRRTARALIRVYNDLFNQIVRNLRSAKLIKAEDDFPFDPKIFDAAIKGVLNPSIGEAYQSGFDVEASAGEFTLFQDPKENLTFEYIRDQQGAIGTYTERETQIIRQSIFESITADDPTKVLSKLENLFNKLTSRRIQSLSRNFVADAFEQSRLDHWTTPELDGVATGKGWAPSIGGANDRIHHNRIPADNGIIGLKDLFRVVSPSVGVVFLRRPNDFQSSVAESRHCACTMFFDFSQSRNGAIIKRERNLELIRT